MYRRLTCPAGRDVSEVCGAPAGVRRPSVGLAVLNRDGSGTRKDRSFFRLGLAQPRSLPTGRYLAVTVNPSTFQVMDLGLGKHAPPVPLRSYGPVSDLTR
jgi:hypothetical protein